jgi:hypothetical protein
MLSALATDGSQMAVGEPIRFTCRIGRLTNVTYCGTTRTAAGIMSVASMRKKTTFPSAGRRLDSE